MIKNFNLQLFATSPITPTTTNTHVEANFGKLLEPGLRKIFFETYGELPEQYTGIYNIEKSSKAKETDWGMGAFGDWTKRASEVDAVDYKKLSPGLERTYTHSAFTQGFIISREMYDDDQYRQMNKMPAAMARSGRAKVEKDAVSFLGARAFSKDVGGAGLSAIYDGKALFDNTHPLLDGGATVGKNLLTPAAGETTTALTSNNLKKALELMQATVDEAGNLAQFRGTKLIVPPALQDAAIRITGSDKVVGSNNNDTNKYLNSYGLEIVVLDYLSAAAGGSDTNWFIQDGNRHELNFFWRIRPEFKWEEDFDSFVSKYRGYMRYSYGISDWRGMVGATGL